jgi:uncharacterized protein YecE (DUF72 family)
VKSGKIPAQESLWTEPAAEQVTEYTKEGAASLVSKLALRTAQLPAKGLAAIAGMRLGTSAFTAAGWPGTFYPAGISPRDYLSYYSQRFDTVEVDSTFYGCPAASRVRGWYEKTPPGFIFSAKVPQDITHEKCLLDCDTEMAEFVSRMELLGEKLGPLLLQFGHFNETVFRSVDDFLVRLIPFLDKLPQSHRFALEIRNKHWLTAKFTDVLRERGIALALIDQSWMPEWMRKPQEWAERQVDLLTADFTYLRWLGDRKGIETLTKSWDKTIIDRKSDLQKWVDACVVIRKRGADIYAYANNHYAGHGPATLALFADLYAAETTQK